MEGKITGGTEDIVPLASKLKGVKFSINSRIDEINSIIDRLEI